MARWHGRKGRPWQRIRAQVLGASTICHLCGRDGADTVDHVIPRSLRPDLAHDLANLRPAHRSCNSSKGARLGTAPLGASRDW